MLGHQAMGIELDAVLAENSRTFLTDHGLSAEIETGNYLDRIDAADYFYVYAWLSQIPIVLDQFVSTAPADSLLLLWEGQNGLRARRKCVAT